MLGPHPLPATIEDIVTLCDGTGVDEAGRVLVPVGHGEIAVELFPEAGVVAAADLPGLDGYRLHVAAGPEGPASTVVGDRADQMIRILSDDADLTEALLDGRVRAALHCLGPRGLELVVGRDRASVHGWVSEPRAVADIVALLAALCARPARIAARAARMYRRFAGIASGPRWNCVDFQVTLATHPTVRVDWPRRRRAGGAPALVTRLRAETAELPLGFAIVDTQRTAIDPGAMPLDVPDVARGRFALTAHLATSLDAAFARVTPALPYVGAAMPHHVAVTAEGVEIVFAGLEEQTVAIEPAVSLARVLAGRPAHAAGPYR